MQFHVLNHGQAEVWRGKARACGKAGVYIAVGMQPNNSSGRGSLVLAKFTGDNDFSIGLNMEGLRVGTESVARIKTIVCGSVDIQPCNSWANHTKRKILYEVSTHQDFPICLNANAAYVVGKLTSGVKTCIKGSVGVEARNRYTFRTIEGFEPTAHQNFSIGLQSQDFGGLNRSRFPG